MKFKTENWQTTVTYDNDEEYQQWGALVNGALSACLVLVVIIPQILLLWAFYAYGSKLIAS